MRASAPPRIKPGDTVGVIAPAGPVKPGAQDQLKRGLDRLGAFAIRLAPTLTSPRAADVPSYLAASDDQRADELTAMLRDPDVRAIVLARGGYGITRILERLDPGDLRRDPKPIVGFSDGTALLSWAYSAGVRGIHGPMAVQLGNLPASDAEHLVKLLTDPTPPGLRPWSRSLGSYTGAGEVAVRGHLVPANLTMASVLVGTSWQLPFDNAIVLLEEVGERPYEIDRYLTHLMTSGMFDDIAGLIFGDLTRCEDPNPPTGVPDPPNAAMRTVCERSEAIDKPAAYFAPIGHGDRNEAVPFGAACELDLSDGDGARFSILEGAVA
jgi:muramoyltetrapeptide carboxypeptidase